MNVTKSNFNELSKEDLYQILRLRTEVFVVEQNCPYQECDNLDHQSLHYFFKEKGTVIAYLRIIPPTQGFVKIGRVVVAKNQRQNGYGILIMKAAIKDCFQQYSDATIKISAQQYLHRFYTDLGFQSTGKEYLEDGIPHQEMIYKSV